MTDLSEVTDAEIKAEYAERFGAPDETDLSNLTSRDLIAELEDRGTLPGAEIPTDIEEIADLIAEAARASRHAMRAYGLLLDAYPDLSQLESRQMLIAGRMAEVA